MKVNVLTPIRFGGPFKWGQDLVSLLNKNDLQATHIHTLFSLSKSCLYQNVDIVHTTAPFPFRLWKKPIVFTIHGDYTIEANIWQRFIPKTITRADAITVPSQYLKQKLGLDEAVVIPNAVFPQRFKPAQHGDKDELNLVTIMSFYFPDKVRGLLNIIEILGKVRNCRLKYTIVGGGPYLEKIKHQINVIKKVAVKFTGFLPEPKPVLATSDVFLYYSYHDSFSIPILEAMASGLPVITNNFGPPSEIIDNEKNGYIAESDESYLKYLLSLLGDYKLRQKIGQNARAKTEEKFNWDKVVDRYIQIYNKF